jgi:hypothetical protein
MIKQQKSYIRKETAKKNDVKYISNKKNHSIVESIMFIKT